MSSMMSYNLQLEDTMDTSAQHSIDLIVSLLLTTAYITSLLNTIYIYIYQKVFFKLHPYINSDRHQ